LADFITLQVHGDFCRNGTCCFARFFQLKDFLGYFINLFEKTGRFGTVFALFYSKVFGALKLYDERELSLCLI